MRAMGAPPDYFRDHRIEITPVAEKTAAESWFGDALPRLVARFDHAWREEVRDGWSRRHAQIVSDRDARTRLEAAVRAGAALGADDAWRLLALRIEADDVADPDAEVLAFTAAFPRHGASRLAWGRANLSGEPARALAALRAAALLDPACAPEVARRLAEHFVAREEPAEKAVGARYGLMAERFPPGGAG
jgi:hypothetical protein